MLNEQCDKSCDNDYCSAYSNPASSTIWDSQQIQHDADLEQCTSEIQHADECLLSSINSTFLDPLVSWSSDAVCKSGWIGDGTCDDLCRTVKCSQDNGDCESGCGGTCDFVNFGWSVFDAFSLWKLNHNWFCAEKWAMAGGLAGEFVGSDNCEETLQSMDFNQDGSLNFREFTALIGRIIFGFEDQRFMQINCSACVSAGLYNI